MLAFNENRRIAKNTIYMYVRMFVIMTISLYTTRVVLKTLGIVDYGVFNIVGSIVILFSFINSGLSGATKRYVLAELAIGNLFSQRKVFSLAINAHLLIIVVILFLGETIGLWFLLNVMNIPSERVTTALFVYHISLIISVINILLSPFISLIISYEKMSIYAYLSIFDVFLKLFILFFVNIFNGDRLICYSILLLCISLVIFLLYISYCYIHFPMCRYVRVKDQSLFRSILRYVCWTFFGTSTNVLSKHGVNLLINNYFSVVVNAAMGVSNMVVSATSQFVSGLQTAFAPQLTKKYLSGNNIELISLVFKSSRYTSFLLLIIIIPIFFLISDLLYIWLEEYPNYTEEFCILTLFCVFFEAISSPLTTVITSDENIRNYQVLISCIYFLNFIISWFFLFLGTLPYSVFIVRVFLSFFLIGVKLSFIKSRLCDFPVCNWILSVIGKAFLIVFLCFPLFFINKYIIVGNHLLRLFCLGSFYLMWVLFFIWHIGLSNKEKNFLIFKFNIKCKNDN